MDATARYAWWPVLHVVLAVAALTHGLTIVLVWVANLLLAVDEASGEELLGTMFWLGMAEIGLSVLVVGGLAVGAWLHRPLWARGVASVITGMVLHWGWWFLDRKVDVFGTADLSRPDLVARTELRVWTMLGVDAAAVILLVLGGALLLWHRPRLEDVAPAPDNAADLSVEAAAARKL